MHVHLAGCLDAECRMSIDMTELKLVQKSPQSKYLFYFGRGRAGNENGPGAGTDAGPGPLASQSLARPRRPPPRGPKQNIIPTVAAIHHK